MQGDINLKTVLIECLQDRRHVLNICSKNYNGLEPARGMEEVWQRERKKVDILQDAVHAVQSEPVRRAMADWQKEVMQEGTPKSIKFDGEDEVMAIHEGRSAESNLSDYPKES